MNRIPLVVMWLVVIIEAFWYFLLLFFFRPTSFPIGVVLISVTWVMLAISLYLFIREVPRPALIVAYVAVLASMVIFGVGAGSSLFLESVYRDVPNLIFLVAAHFAYKRSSKASNTLG